MAILLDTAMIPLPERDDALSDLFAQAGVPIHVSHAGVQDGLHTQIHRWQFGSNDLFLASGSGLRLTRGRAELRVAAPEGIRVGYQISGHYTLSSADYGEANGAGHLNFTDMTRPCEFTQFSNRAAVMSFEIDYDQLGFPVDEVRQAGRMLASSPVYGLLRHHMARLGQSPGALTRGASGQLVGSAAIDLVRAVIASVGQADLASGDVMEETLPTRIAAYICLHLREPGLRPAQIANAQHMSVRHLYRIWSTAHELSLAEWILTKRLEGARRTLASPSARLKSTQAVSRAWGFADPTHFSRRFRQAYGMSPGEWRRLG